MRKLITILFSIICLSAVAQFDKHGNYWWWDSITIANTGHFRFIPTAQNGYVFTSDATGNATWQPGGWGLTGNTGTNYTVNYIGTNDSVPFVTRTNGLPRWLLKADGSFALGYPNLISPTTLILSGNLNELTNGSNTDTNGIFLNAQQHIYANAISMIIQATLSQSGGDDSFQPTGVFRIIDPADLQEVANQNSKFSIISKSGSSAFQDSDGTQHNGYVFTSDSNGNATWQALGAIDTAFWSTTGNRGITSANFLGTTDTNALVFKTDTVISGVLSFTNTSYGWGSFPYTHWSNNEYIVDNTAIGGASMSNVDSNSTVYNNVALGTATLGAMRHGHDNVAIGNFAMANNFAISTDIAIGSYALESDSNGNNIAIGFETLKNHGTGNMGEGEGNVAIGNDVMPSSAAGTNNTAVGTFAMLGDNYGLENTAIGFSALDSGSGGLKNSAVGAYALYRNAEGSENVAIGWAALLHNIGCDSCGGNGNTGIGYLALDSNVSGSYNTALGYHANTGDTLLHINGSTAIGANSEVDTSNALILGSISGVNNATYSVNVGIGTTKPVARLDLVGNIKITDGTQGAGKVLTSDANGNASWQINSFPVAYDSIATISDTIRPALNTFTIVTSNATITNAVLKYPSNPNDGDEIQLHYNYPIATLTYANGSSNGVNPSGIVAAVLNFTWRATWRASRNKWY